MLDSQKELLRAFPHRVIAIGITRDGRPLNCIPIPWMRTGHAFNMRTPDVYFTPEDTQDPAMMALLESFEVIGFYCFAPLKSYGFLSRLTRLQDIYICHGQNLRDLSFLENNTQWFMLYLEDATLPDLAPLFARGGRDTWFHSYCLGLCNCRVEDISALYRNKFRLSELVILEPKGSDLRKRWEDVPAMEYAYMEYDTD